MSQEEKELNSESGELYLEATKDNILEDKSEKEQNKRGNKKTTQIEQIHLKQTAKQRIKSAVKSSQKDQATQGRSPEFNLKDESIGPDIIAYEYGD